MRGALALLAGCACAAGACRGKRATDDDTHAGSGAPAPAPADAASRPRVPDQITGTLTLGGAPLAIASCRPGRDASIYVDLVTAAGVLRFVPYTPELRFRAPGAAGPGAPLACADLQRSWGGGTRPDDGTTYFRGRLIFTCTGDAGAFAGDVTVDCGDITPAERELLDRGRREKLDELQRGGGGSGGGSG